MGAIEPLLHEAEWRQFGELTPEECAREWLEIFFSFETACALELQTPYWDTAEDVDDDAPPESQTWYGSATITDAMTLTAEADPEITFVENAFIWAFAGLMAFSGQPGAAIAYLTVAPKFVIAFKTGDWGGVVSIFVDAVRVFQGSTYTVDPGILHVPIVGDVDLSEHQIYVVNEGDEGEQMKVIRKELSPDEVTPPGTRYNSECDCIQQTPDGGTTWVDAPGLDPRSAPGFQVPPNPSGNPQCDAAARMTAAIRGLVNAYLNQAAALSAVNAILGVILVLLPGYGILIDLILAVVEAFAAIGQAAIAAAMTDEVYDQLLCILAASVNEDGSITQDEIDDAFTQVESQIGGIAATVIGEFFNILGANGLSNAAAERDETGDCAACSNPANLVIINYLGTDLGANLVHVSTLKWTVDAVEYSPGVFYLALCSGNPGLGFVVTAWDYTSGGGVFEQDSGQDDADDCTPVMPDLFALNTDIQRFQFISNSAFSIQLFAYSS